MALHSITYKTIATKLVSLALIVGLLGTSTLISVSKDTLPKLIDEWYSALRITDADKFEILLADNASIELKFLGVSQSKSEFIDALDEWQNANKDAKITTKLISTDTQNTIVETCYRFPSNEVHGRETFTIIDGKIVKSVQEEISDSCADI